MFKRNTIAGTQSSRSAFTLIELLVVVLILLILAAMTAGVVNLVVDGDKVRSAGRQIQSYLEGARDRAIYAKNPRGVRFNLDPDNPRVVSSMVYVEQPKSWSLGALQVERLDIGAPGFNPDGAADTPEQVIVVSEPDDLSAPYAASGPKTGWKELYDRKLIGDGTIIRIGGIAYRVEMSGDYDLLKNAGGNFAGTPYASRPYPPKLVLSTRFKDSPQIALGAANDVRGFNTTLSYELELPPVPLAGESPSQLPDGTVIHLDRSSTVPGVATSRGDKLPSSWKYPLTSDPSGFGYRGQLDIMFSPRGVVTGSAATAGVIHLYVGLRKDALLDQTDWAVPQTAIPEFGRVTRAGDSFERGDKFAVSVFTRTGAVSTHPIHPGEDVNFNGTLESVEDKNSNMTLDGDPFRYAETGEVAPR